MRVEDLQYRLQASASELIAFLVRAHRAEVIEALGVDWKAAARAYVDTFGFGLMDGDFTDVERARLRIAARQIVNAALGIEEFTDE